MTTLEASSSSRARLLSLLSEACELEHGLLCSYLYSAFSLKQDLTEGGMTWEQQQKVRSWAAQIYAVAAEEMLHLGQAWNLLAAIGGTPYYSRPNFPQSAKYYKLNLPLQLQPFGEAALKRFIMYELPARVKPEDMARELELPPQAAPSSSDLTVGELYGLILESFEAIPQDRLFIGDPARQVTQDIVDFPDIVKVTDLDSARRAIHMITEQGEGTESEDDNCHFGMFRRVLQDYQSELRSDASRTFMPVRNVAENPAPRLRGNWGSTGVTVIQHPFTVDVAEYFDDIYELMLRMLQFVFSNNTVITDALREFARSAIVTMPTVIKPLGEALTLLPVQTSSDLRAGAAFGMSRHVPLPADTRAARVMVDERLHELISVGRRLASSSEAPVQLQNAVINLERYSLRAVT